MKITGHRRGAAESRWLAAASALRNRGSSAAPGDLVDAVADTIELLAELAGELDERSATLERNVHDRESLNEFRTTEMVAAAREEIQHDLRNLASSLRQQIADVESRGSDARSDDDVGQVSAWVEDELLAGKAARTEIIAALDALTGRVVARFDSLGEEFERRSQNAAIRHEELRETVARTRADLGELRVDVETAIAVNNAAMRGREEELAQLVRQRVAAEADDIRTWMASRFEEAETSSSDGDRIERRLDAMLRLVNQHEADLMQMASDRGVSLDGDRPALVMPPPIVQSDPDGKLRVSEVIGDLPVEMAVKRRAARSRFQVGGGPSAWGRPPTASVESGDTTE